MKIFRFVLFFASLFFHNMEPQTQKSDCVGGKKVPLLTNVKSEDNNSDLLQELFFR